MMNPFDIWAPIFRAPFSGDVTQAIVPKVLSPTIQGNPEIEAKIETEVASTGKQLGKILEALQVLARVNEVELTEVDQAKLAEIDKLVDGVEAVKAAQNEAYKERAKTALAQLKKVDEAAWREVIDPKAP